MIKVDKVKGFPCGPFLITLEAPAFFIFGTVGMISNFQEKQA